MKIILILYQPSNLGNYRLPTLSIIPKIFGYNFDLDQGYKTSDRTSQAARPSTASQAQTLG